MRLNHVPCLESLPTPITPKSLMTPITQCQSTCMIKSIIFGLHPIIILQNKIHLFSNQKIFGCYTSMIIIFKTMCLFMGNEFSRSHRRLRKPSYTFTIGQICITKNTWAFTQGGIYPYLLLPDTYFHFHLYNHATLLDVVPPYQAHLIKHQMKC